MLAGRPGSEGVVEDGLGLSGAVNPLVNDWLRGDKLSFEIREGFLGSCMVVMMVMVGVVEVEWWFNGYQRG